MTRTPQDKIKEIKHIQKMIVNGGIANEINARVWCVNNGYYPDMVVNSSIPYPMWKDPSALGAHYLNSLDAIKGLEREGWMYTIIIEPSGETRVIAETMHLRLNNIRIVTPPTLPTEQAARLYAVLLTWIYEEENKDETRL